MSTAQKVFVFVVCGAKEHIDTLNFSLIALRSFTSEKILVVTDLKRNEAPILHPSEFVVNVDVDVRYDHHQASILLKTGLHEHVPMDGTVYCYLDTDVVAVDERINDIFDNYRGPITFATDHCKMGQFSGHAVNCGCFMPKELKKRIDHYRDKFSHLRANEALVEKYMAEWLNFERGFPFDLAKIEWYNGLIEKNTSGDEKKKLLKRRERLIRLTDPDLPKPKLILNYLFRVLPFYRRSLTSKTWSDWQGNVLLDEGKDYHAFMNSRGFHFDSAKGYWTGTDGQRSPENPKTFDSFFAEKGIRYQFSDETWYTIDGKLFWPNLPKLVESEGTYWYDKTTDVWFDNDNKAVSLKECDHLRKAISDSFSIQVQDTNWQHWNGGVFLFSSDSIQFLDTWYDLTLETFGLPYWKTRDQGTLIATVWKYGLQKHPVLPIEFNFIADYFHPNMTYIGNFQFRFGADGAPVSPCFIHIYHQWGNEDWALWNDVSKLVSSVSS